MTIDELQSDINTVSDTLQVNLNEYIILIIDQEY